MDLIKSHPNIPIKAIPEKMVDEFLETKFKYFISKMLSLKSDKEEDVTDALPAIKKHFWSLGVKEIEKAFEMYVDGQLQTKPIPNHFNRILVGQIFNDYKQAKKARVEPVNEDEYKKQQDDFYTILAFDKWAQERTLHHDNHWIYTYLKYKGLLYFTKEEKQKKIDVVTARQSENINETAMTMLLCDYFARLEAKDEHIKSLL